MADLTIADVLEPPSKDQLKEDLREVVATDDFPVTNWQSGGVMRTLLELEAEVLSDLVAQAIPILVGQAFADSADTDWLRALAIGAYGLTPGSATYPSQAVTLACATGFGPYPIAAGALVAVDPAGRRYIAITGGTLSGGGTLDVTFTAETPGAARALVSALSSPLPGVTFADVGIAIISLVPQFGADEESDPALALRCQSRWPDLSLVPADDRLVRWAKAASTEVTRVRLDADFPNPGGIVVTVAGPSGAVSGGAVTAVQAYFDARSPITDYNTAQNATNLAIDAAGTVTVTAATEAAVQAAANAAWVAYLMETQIGATVFLSRLIQAVMDAGARDFTGATLNANGDVALGSTQVPIPGGDLAAQLTWNVAP